MYLTCSRSSVYSFCLGKKNKEIVGWDEEIQHMLKPAVFLISDQTSVRCDFLVVCYNSAWIIAGPISHDLRVETNFWK